MHRPATPKAAIHTISQEAYFAELVDGRPLMSALQPASGLLGKEYAHEVSAETGHHLHLRGGVTGGDELGLWRISLAAVDAWSLRSPDGNRAQDGKGPFARLLGA
jgi:hypothetical protein